MKNNRAKSFVVIMIIIAISVLFLRILVDRVINFTCIQNESSAQSTLKLISVALENYSKDNRNAYPDKFSVLTQGNLAYLDKDYTRQPLQKGYTYNCSRLDATGYSCYAFPSRCNLTGRLAFTVTTGGLFISENCAEKE